MFEQAFCNAIKLTEEADNMKFADMTFFYKKYIEYKRMLNIRA